MKKIIFAEDDPTIQDVVSHILQDQYEIRIFSQGEELLKYEYELPDLFLLDKQLSGIDGLEICRFLKAREQTKHIPIIIISATPALDKLAKSAGADNIIEKPFSVKALREMIARYIQ